MRSQWGDAASGGESRICAMVSSCAMWCLVIVEPNPRVGIEDGFDGVHVGPGVHGQSPITKHRSQTHQ